MGYNRSIDDKRRLIKLYNKTKYSFGSGAYYNEKKKRFVRIYPSNTSGFTKYLRRISNRRVRRSKELLNRCQYRKVYDYWWTLF